MFFFKNVFFFFGSFFFVKVGPFWFSTIRTNANGSAGLCWVAPKSGVFVAGSSGRCALPVSVRCGAVFRCGGICGPLMDKNGFVGPFPCRFSARWCGRVVPGGVGCGTCGGWPMVRPGALFPAGGRLIFSFLTYVLLFRFSGHGGRFWVNG